MVFSSLVFLFVFLPVVLAAYYLSSSRGARNAILLLSSIGFYAWGEPVYVVLMLVSTAANWALALAIKGGGPFSRAWLTVGVALNLAGIGVFKYADFVVANGNLLLGTSWQLPGIVLPIGISFYTFQAISYLLDVYWGSVPAQRSVWKYATYHTLFPQLVAGPIVRYASVQQEVESRTERMGDFADGLRRFCLGLGKKVLLANSFGQIADAVLAGEPTVGLIPAWYAFVAYAFQIYFDFSGYSDMAIGLGRMFGFHFLENFAHPYVAQSVTEFWRRWHISLSTFFRDYVYFPLGGSRVRPARLIFNLIVVWSLTGLWHGANWNYVAWGLYYALVLAGEKLVWGGVLAGSPRVFRHTYTVAGFMAGWVIFRTENFGSMSGWFCSLCGLQGSGSVATLNALNVLHVWPWFLAGALGCTPLGRIALARMWSRSRSAWLADAWVAVVFVWSILDLVGASFNPFIYFRF